MKATLFFALISLPVILNAQDTLLLMDFNGPDTSLIISGQPSGNNDPYWVNYDSDGLADANGRPQEWFITSEFSNANPNNLVFASSSMLTAAQPGNLNYFISPRIDLPITPYSPLLTRKSAPFQTPKNVDGYCVVVSTTDNQISSFTDTVFRASQFIGLSADSLGISPIPQYNWFEYSYGFVHGFDGTGLPSSPQQDSTKMVGEQIENRVDLSPYENLQIHIAFIHNSDADNMISIDDIVISTVLPVGNGEIVNSAGIKIFPNPVADVLRVEGIDEDKYEVYDLLGRLVLKGTIEDEINVSGLLAGTYILRIGNESKRFVKE